MTAEQDRLAQAPNDDDPWKLWGPYVAGRQWGTVREDYSADGDAWASFPFDHAHRRAYRWGEDGLGAFCDRYGFFNLGIALWNGQDDRLKERLFGLTNAQGNHGEDVKEVWWVTDGTPTHSYAQWLYRYPQAAFPYADLLATNAARGKADDEYELTDTGVLAQDRFTDVEVTWAKAGPTDLVLQVAATNRGPDAVPLDLIVQGWFRNTWSWGRDDRTPSLTRDGDGVLVQHAWLGTYRLVPETPGARILFCDNETDRSLYGEAVTGCPKNGLDRAIVQGDETGVRDDKGTKAGLCWRLQLDPGQTQTVRVRLTGVQAATPSDRTAQVAPIAEAGGDSEQTLATRRAEADEFYAAVIPAEVSDADRFIARRAFAGLLWGKQLYRYSITEWLAGDPAQPTPPAVRHTGRNARWDHLDLADVISMPDEWEYPWFATWDLAFHAVALAHVDPEFAKRQLELMCWEWAQHPNGQLPAYEWNFDDVNPPVHAWATWKVFLLDGGRDTGFLVRVFTKLLMNFSWWINRKDADGSYLFEGGFLGMDNIGFFDRSKPLPDGMRLEQSDATSWMAFYALSMLRIAVQLTRHDLPGFESTARTFFEYFLRLAGAMDDFGSSGISLWSEQDGCYYDVIVHRDGTASQLPVLSLVGMLPLIAVEAVPPEVVDRLPGLLDEVAWIARRNPELSGILVQHESDNGGRITIALTDKNRRARLLDHLLNESELLSPFGIRSLSATYRGGREVTVDGVSFTIEYDPAESRSNLFGGNSNWRGPVWLPINVLLVDALRAYAAGSPAEDVPFPAGASTRHTLGQVADALEDRLTSLFRPGADGRRPGTPRWYPSGPLWDDQVTFSEYFDGDTGAGLGATHQTGWTAMVAHLLCDRPVAGPQGTNAIGSGS
ncbi:MGH1-like glycoside hydrolase domain-containing protein [Metallococcus carri]|uniref:MGH1-like glycoside hydrolase domain-containing protein n=1 Tax=Metallococcus carri TaxID=1656884 RepID=UPI002E2AB702|nr:glucosidase [Metallococcus carri]